ncbi:hypothetical protein TUM12370_37200 [Salmonella enterica subsp. enterica serovar Choleraesuis]|nr:hypothetical protein TUM12370_37200 [Salmonella enterica subsp. enterica serovar Choleraesuis]
MKNSHIPESTVEDVILWIEDNIHENLSLDKISRHVGYSKWHFQRLFHYYTGEAIAEFIRKKKLYLAMRELKDSETSIITIALNYSFNSHQSFSRAFRTNFGCTPSLCRSRRSQKIASLNGPELCRACLEMYTGKQQLPIRQAG